jgi:hypothetical protein
VSVLVCAGIEMLGTVYSICSWCDGVGISCEEGRKGNWFGGWVERRWLTNVADHEWRNDLTCLSARGAQSIFCDYDGELMYMGVQECTLTRLISI